MQKRGKEKGRPWLNNASWLVLFILVTAGFYWLVYHDQGGIALKYGELKQVLHDPSVTFQKVQAEHAEVLGEIVTRDQVTDGTETSQLVTKQRFHTSRLGLENDTSLPAELDRAAPSYQGQEDDSAIKSISSLVLSFLLLVALIGAAFFLIRWLAGGSSPLTFGRSKHKLYAEKDLHITFQDVAGIDEAVAELREVVDFLKTPEKYQALGGRIPKGVLLVGPPGTGKTLLAKAVAGEADVPFFSLSGSDFVEMFVGVGAARVRDLFAQAESRAPCIIFIDELDALGKTPRRQRRRRPRRARADAQSAPGRDGRLRFQPRRDHHGGDQPAGDARRGPAAAGPVRPHGRRRSPGHRRPRGDPARSTLATSAWRRMSICGTSPALTPGSVGADLANLVNEAALMAARNSKEAVTMAEFDEAVERGAVGLERKSRIMHADEKQRVAYHEAGHALVACALPNTDPVHKISIIPRGVGALGYVLQPARRTTATCARNPSWKATSRSAWAARSPRS